MKRVNTKNNTVTVIFVALMSILLLSSVLGLFTEHANTSQMTITLEYYINGQNYAPTNVSVDANTTLYTLIDTKAGGLTLQQDGKVKCVGQYCNNFLAGTSWTIFLNNYPETNLAATLHSGDYVTLYYGETMEFGNITLTVNVQGLVQSEEVLIRDGMSVASLLSSYQSNYTGNTLNCLFNICNNANYTWTVSLNNATIADYSAVLAVGDDLMLKYE